jgi:hypothetical protein
VQVEIGFQPNCSEVVLHVQSLTKDELLPILEEIGIREEEVEQFWGHQPDEEPEVVIADDNNPNMPDYVHKAHMSIKDDYVGCGTYSGGCCVIGHQHCQQQLYPTMKHIADFLEAKGLQTDGWNGDDGGSTDEYEEWIEKGEKPIKIDPAKVEQYTGGLNKEECKPIISYLGDTYGIKAKYVPHEGMSSSIDFDYDPDKIKTGLLRPDRFGGTSLPKWMHKIRTDLNEKIKEVRMAREQSSKKKGKNGKHSSPF